LELELAINSSRDPGNICSEHSQVEDYIQRMEDWRTWGDEICLKFLPDIIQSGDKAHVQSCSSTFFLGDLQHMLFLNDDLTKKISVKTSSCLSNISLPFRAVDTDHACHADWSIFHGPAAYGAAAEVSYPGLFLQCSARKFFRRGDVSPQ
jgi:hypothetical protein